MAREECKYNGSHLRWRRGVANIGATRGRQLSCETHKVHGASSARHPISKCCGECTAKRDEGDPTARKVVFVRLLYAAGISVRGDTRGVIGVIGRGDAVTDREAVRSKSSMHDVGSCGQLPETSGNRRG